MKSPRILLIVLICLASIYFKCNNKTTEDKDKEHKYMLEIDQVPYPVRYANFQRNSFVPLKTFSTGKILSSKSWIEINPRLQIIPLVVHLSDKMIGIRSNTSVIILKSNLEFQEACGIAEGTPIVFGKSAWAYIKNSYLLEYKDYSGNLLLEAREFPAMGEFASLKFFKPTNTDFTAATFFTGGPSREPKYFDLYKIKIEESSRTWSYSGDGIIDEVLLTPDNKTLLLFREYSVTFLNSNDGKIESTFNTQLENFLTASLDLENNIVIIGEATVNSNKQIILKKMDLTGNDIWSFNLSSSIIHQPPVCGPNGLVYIVNGINLCCIRDGKIVWQKLLTGDKTLMTVLTDNTLLVLNNSSLYKIDKEGESLFEIKFSSGESFSAPPAVDSDGKIYVAGEENLYCIE